MRMKLAALVAGLVIFGMPAASQTVDEIIAKNVQARGGLEKLKAVQSMRITGTAMLGPGVEAPFVIQLKRPMHSRMEFTVQGMTGIQGYDGKIGWMVMPFEGKKDPEPMSADDLKEAEESADMDGPLVDYKEKGSQVELAGKEDVEGAPAYKLKITLKNGDTIYQYLDADSYLAVKEETRRMVRGTEQDIEESIGDYKEVEGLMLPFAREGGVKGSQERQKFTIDKIELNAKIDDSVFAMPAAPPPAPAESKPGESKPGESKPAESKPPLNLDR